MIEFGKPIKTPLGEMHAYEVEMKESGAPYVVKCTDRSGLKHEFLLTQVDDWNKTLAQELVDQGYYPVSNSYRMLHRIDRADWLQHMARHMNLTVADFYKHDGTLGERWGEHYCRVHSKDGKTVDQETYQAVKKLWGSRTPTYVGAAPATKTDPLAAAEASHKAHWLAFGVDTWPKVAEEFGRVLREYNDDLRKQGMRFTARKEHLQRYLPIALRHAVEMFLTVTPKV